MHFVNVRVCPNLLLCRRKKCTLQVNNWQEREKSFAYQLQRQISTGLDAVEVF